MNAGTWLFKRSIISPNKTAIVSEQGLLTYHELNSRVNRLSHFLLKLNLRPGDRVAVLSRNRPEFLEVYFASAKLALIFVPLNFRMAPPELAYQLVDSGVSVLVFDMGFAALVRESIRFITVNPPKFISLGRKSPDWSSGYEGWIIDQPAEEPPTLEEATSLDTPQMIMYTSGTTGTPKGALLSHRKTLFNTLNAQIYFDLFSNDVMLIALPLFHSGGLNIMAVPTIYAGGKIVLESKFDPKTFLTLVEKHRVTQAMLVPTMLNTILNECRPEDFDLSSLRSVLIGGEPVSADLMHRAQDNGIPVRQIFGQTETSIELWVPEEMAREKAGSVGLPVFHGEVQVVDDSGRPVIGEVGEIVVKGPIQMTAYWNMPEETQKTIRNGWLHTRDLGKVDEQGFFYAVDRMGDMYISGGENVYPAEVEKVLLNHPKIYEVAIIGIPHPKWGKTGHAFIKLRNRQETLDYNEVVSFLRGKVASYKIPKDIEIVNELPKTASGKIRKSELVCSVPRKIFESS